MQHTNEKKNLIWSETITRTDDPTLAEKVNLLNNGLARLCETRKGLTNGVLFHDLKKPLIR